MMVEFYLTRWSNGHFIKIGKPHATFMAAINRATKLDKGRLWMTFVDTKDPTARVIAEAQKMMKGKE